MSKRDTGPAAAAAELLGTPRGRLKSSPAAVGWLPQLRCVAAAALTLLGSNRRPCPSLSSADCHMRTLNTRAQADSAETDGREMSGAGLDRTASGARQAGTSFNMIHTCVLGDEPRGVCSLLKSCLQI